MAKINRIYAREVLDSRGNPTVEVELELEDLSLKNEHHCDGIGKWRAIVPSGASTWIHEALELRDQDPKRYGWKWVLIAVDNVNKFLASSLLGKVFSSVQELDKFMLELDGTPNKSHFGANAILWVSMAFVSALADLKNSFVYQILAKWSISLPIPMMNILNWGVHADNNVDIQEFLIVPIQAKDFAERLRMGSEVFHTLKALLQGKGYVTSVWDEWGYAPLLSSNEEAFDLIVSAIQEAWYTTEQIKIAIDSAASEWYHNGLYLFSGKERSVDYLMDFYSKIVKKYPIISIEDAFAEDDLDSWKIFESQFWNHIMNVWDDLLVTDSKRIQMALDQKLCNSALIKLNQVGTVSETLWAIDLAQKNGMKVVISHRSWETEDTFIADLAVAVHADYIKTWSLSRSERIAKYNQLLRIEESL